MLPTQITQEMTQSTDIYTLRQFGFVLNGTRVQANLGYVPFELMKYTVTGAAPDGKRYQEAYWTQDEAEQEYIYRVAAIQGAMQETMRIQQEQLDALQAHLNGEPMQRSVRTAGGMVFTEADVARIAAKA